MREDIPLEFPSVFSKPEELLELLQEDRKEEMGGYSTGRNESNCGTCGVWIRVAMDTLWRINVFFLLTAESSGGLDS